MSPLPPSLPTPWNRCIGSDRVATMLRSEYWDHFDQVQAMLGAEYIRCHGLLHDELGVVRRDRWEGRERLWLNFTYLDQVFDAMLDRGVRPFVEWGFMPAALASGSDTVFWWKGLITPPADESEWAFVVEGLVRHWQDRYGVDEVRRWLFEVWNEPNLTVFWKDADQGRYFDLYRVTVGTIKAVDPQLRVGGPAICGGSDHWIEDFLGYVRTHRLPLDFFTRHLYLGQPATVQSPDVFWQDLAPVAQALDELKDVRRRIDAAGFPGLPLHITEFNTSYHPLCPVHDTPRNAAVLARLLAEVEGVASMSYWTFGDLFEEADVPRAPFHGGFGLVARGGIPKPTFHLFAFLQAARGTIVSQSDSHVVTQTARGWALVAWHPVDRDGGHPTRSLRVSLPPECGGMTWVRRRVAEGLGDPRAVWQALGQPHHPDRATVEVLRLAAQPGLEVGRLGPEADDFELSLLPNEVTLVELRPRPDESADYWGLPPGVRP